MHERHDILMWVCLPQSFCWKYSYVLWLFKWRNTTITKSFH